MYEELIKRLNERIALTTACSPLQDDLLQAADAIKKLSAKATPKRVGYSGWKGCRDTRYKCPYCNKYVRNDEEYCHKCGQALVFPHISHTPYIPGEKQEVIVTWPDEPSKEET
jgi:hypothetical protein